jgi:ribosome-binding protein aMBF1 (putative translation factor)
MKTLHTDDERAEIILTVPTEETPKVTEALIGLFKLAGHELSEMETDEEIDDNKLYSIEEVFPDICPAKILRGARFSRELDQTELAAKLGITQSRLSEMENGKRPISRKMAAKLGKFFDMPAKTFITV